MKYSFEIGTGIIFVGLHFLPGTNTSWYEVLGICIILTGLAVLKSKMKE